MRELQREKVNIHKMSHMCAMCVCVCESERDILLASLQPPTCATASKITYRTLIPQGKTGLMGLAHTISVHQFTQNPDLCEKGLL